MAALLEVFFVLELDDSELTLLSTELKREEISEDTEAAREDTDPLRTFPSVDTSREADSIVEITESGVLKAEFAKMLAPPTVTASNAPTAPEVTVSNKPAAPEVREPIIPRAPVAILTKLLDIVNEYRIDKI